VSLLASSGANLARNESGQDTRGLSLTAGASVAPHKTLAITGNYVLTRSRTSGGGKAPQSDDRGRVEGTLSFSPFPALYLAAAVSRFTSAAAPSTLASLTAAFSPFSGGDLLARFSYNETLDSGPTSAPGSGVRACAGTSAPDSGPTQLHRQRFQDAAQDAEARILFASLSLTLR
jgi:hypothetical protein